MLEFYKSMKNRLILILIFFLIANNSFAENINITSKNISIDKKNETTIFTGSVVFIDEKENIIESEYANYNKRLEFFTLKDNVRIKDSNGNIIRGDEALYDKKKDLYKFIGKTVIKTSSGNDVETSNISFNAKTKIVKSKDKTIIKDVENNIIKLDNFDYLIEKSIFKAVGMINVKDYLNNSYEFSQIYIDEKSKEIIGTDSKVYLNNNDFKVNENNKPRVFSNVVNIKEAEAEFVKSTFTMCDYRENDKCPPWELTASKMRHDSKKKTIFYDNAVIKIYNIPIFYIPKLQHPDPTVERRSGFLIPSFSDSSNLGTGLNIPYFWAIDNDKDLTINNKLFATEHPIFLAEYKQAFKNSNLTTELGYTEGYKSTSKQSLRSGDRSHFFAKFKKKFEIDNNSENDMEINLQHVSDKKYLKLYKVESDLVHYETSTLENSIDFNHFNDEEDISLNFNTGVFRTLSDAHNDKYEYILPDLSVKKFLYSENLGYGNFQTNLKIHNYDTNIYNKLLINDFEWRYDKSILGNLYDGKILTKFKNLNYDSQNISKYKSELTNEFYGAIGYFASIDLFKNIKEKSSHFLTPKVLFKFSQEKMRKEKGNIDLPNQNLFSLDRVNTGDNFEGGSNVTVGLDYKNIDGNNELDFSIGQIISKDENKKMPSSYGLDQRFSDVIGKVDFTNNKNFSFNYDFAIDQNYKELNYNNLSADFFSEKLNFNIDYLEENISSNKKEYVNSSFAIKSGGDGLFTLSNKRNLITNSSEFYKLSYEYINDCLRAGLVYRREFYEDSELEPENSLMFTITLSSFGNLESPAFSN